MVNRRDFAKVVAGSSALLLPSLATKVEAQVQVGPAKELCHLIVGAVNVRPHVGANEYIIDKFVWKSKDSFYPTHGKRLNDYYWDLVDEEACMGYSSINLDGLFLYLVERHTQIRQTGSPGSRSISYRWQPIPKIT